MEEVWKPVVGYEGLYEVSNLGRIKSLPRRGTLGGIIKPYLGDRGYLSFNLVKDGKSKATCVHRLVAEAFVPNDDPLKDQVNHKDECKTNNFVWVNEDGTIDPEKSNLEWLTQKENTNWGTRNKRIAKANKNGKQSKPVAQMTLDGTIIKVWPSVQETGRNGYSATHIVQCCKGKRNVHKGFKWVYADFGLMFWYCKKIVINLWPVGH